MGNNAKAVAERMRNDIVAEVGVRAGLVAKVILVLQQQPLQHLALEHVDAHACLERVLLRDVLAAALQALQSVL